MNDMNSWYCVGFEAKEGVPDTLLTVDQDFWQVDELTQQYLVNIGFRENGYQLLEFRANQKHFDGLTSLAGKIIAICMPKESINFGALFENIEESELIELGFNFEWFDVVDPNGMYSAENIMNSVEYMGIKKSFEQAIKILKQKPELVGAPSHNYFSIVKVFSLDLGEC